MKDILKTVGKWFLGFAFVASLFAALSNKLFVSALLWAAMTVVLFLPRDKVKEKFKIDVSNKTKAILIFIGFMAATTLNPEVMGKAAEQSKNKPTEVKQVVNKVADQS